MSDIQHFSQIMSDIQHFSQIMSDIQHFSQIMTDIQQIILRISQPLLEICRKWKVLHLSRPIQFVLLRVLGIVCPEIKLPQIETT
jgi:hypothetical protein